MLRLQNIPGPVTLGMLVLTLLVYNLGGWYIYALSRDLAERELERRLAGIGHTAALSLNEETTPLLLLADPKTGVDPDTDWGPHAYRLASLRQRLRALRDANDLQAVTILGRNLAVLADANEKVTPGTSIESVDAPIIEDAFAFNTTRFSPYYSFNELEHKRCYTPLLSQENTPVAVLRLVAGREYFAELNRMRLYLFAIAAIGSLLLAAVAVALYQLLVAALRSEKAMADADRLQSLGTLAAGLAHEIRNPLGIIRAISEELEEELAQQPEQQELLEDITDEVQRLDGLVSQFLSFARPGVAGAPTPFRLDETLNDVVQLVQKGSGKERVRYVLEQDAALGPLQMEEKSIRQVLLNVLLNARDAVGETGLIHIRVDTHGRFARVRVRDDGQGMDTRQLKRAFDPFYTTKTSGTGLGLSISRNIVERYGGKIAIESEPNKGTTVTILLPVGAK